jgi:hypothetical protein
MLMTKSFPLAHSAQDSPFSSSKSAIFRTVNPKDKPMALEKNHGMKQQLDDALSTIEDVLGNLRPFFLMGKTSNPPHIIGPLGRGFNPLWMLCGVHIHF